MNTTRTKTTRAHAHYAKQSNVPIRFWYPARHCIVVDKEPADRQILLREAREARVPARRELQAVRHELRNVDALLTGIDSLLCELEDRLEGSASPTLLTRWDMLHAQQQRLLTRQEALIASELSLSDDLHQLEDVVRALEDFSLDYGEHVEVNFLRDGPCIAWYPVGCGEKHYRREAFRAHAEIAALLDQYLGAGRAIREVDP